MTLFGDYRREKSNVNSSPNILISWATPQINPVFIVLPSLLYLFISKKEMLQMLLTLELQKGEKIEGGGFELCTHGLMYNPDTC